MRKWYCVTNPHTGSGKTISKWDGAREVLKGIMKCSDETGIPSESFYLAAVPIGSGNDWIRSTGATRVRATFAVQYHIFLYGGSSECPFGVRNWPFLYGTRPVAFRFIRLDG